MLACFSGLTSTVQQLCNWVLTHVWVFVCSRCPHTWRSLEVCHGVLLGCFPFPPHSHYHSVRRAQNLPPLTSGSDLCDTFHSHHPPETEDSWSSRYVSRGTVGLWALCCGCVASWSALEKVELIRLCCVFPVRQSHSLCVRVMIREREGCPVG